MTITLLQDKRIVLGITGSIACYKAADLASKLTQAGAKVEVIMTDSATRFVSPLTLRSVAGEDVHQDMWHPDMHVGHIRLAQQADLLLIAPATAHTLAKLAHGLADNLLTVTAVAARCPVLVAPAMDGGMFEHPATQANLAILSGRGIHVIGPASGRMASGLVGLGRMVEPQEILGHVRLELGRTGPLEGRRVVVTAGPTREPLDPVRFLSNRSTGKQGMALAQAAIDMGAHVSLISGPTAEPVPVGADQIAVESAVQMRDAVLASLDTADVLVMAAAVSDFRPAMRSKEKIKKASLASEGLQVALTRNPDILAEVKAVRSQTGRPRVTVGFAAETSDVRSRGKGKLHDKGLDLIAVNDVTQAGAGFGADTNRVHLLGADGLSEDMPLASKAVVAERIMSLAAERLPDRE